MKLVGLAVLCCISMTLFQALDGVRIRNHVLRSLYKALVPGVPDHRVKGALFQINMPAFAKYAMTRMLIDQSEMTYVDIERT